MKAPALMLLLLGVTLSGCFGGNGGADEAEEEATPKLPPGLTMDDAEVVSYNETTVVWKWTGRISGAYQSGISEEAEASFDVPPGIPLRLEASVALEDPNDIGDGAVFRILDDRGGQRCDTLATDNEAKACDLLVPGLDAAVRWTAWMGEAFAVDVPFTATLSITTDVPQEPEPIDPATLAPMPTTHPYPDGDEGWPVDLEGPFDLGQVITDPVESHDGVLLETTVYLPDLPDGVKAPVVLQSTPYPGSCASNTVVGEGCMAPSDSEDQYNGVNSAVKPKPLVEAGYAVAISNVRGTGNSGGCFSFGGMAEQLDQVALVEHLAEQPWSNGHVAMYGLSYHGYTPWMAAVNAPEALKTIVAAGIMVDLYTWNHSPQGATGGDRSFSQTDYGASLNYLPPAGGGPEHAVVEHAGVLPERVCPDTAQTMAVVPVGAASDVRDGAYWQERNLISRFPEVEAAVFVAHGFDEVGKAMRHSMQDDDVWHSLPAATPKRMILGQWSHELPPPAQKIAQAPFGSDWHDDVLLPWLDVWLKGIGHAAQVHNGTVSYQDENGTWSQSTAWPPAEARHEVLYLAGDGGLATKPEEGSAMFLASEGGDCVLYATEPLDEPVTLAGNPWAYLQVESSQPGGVFAVELSVAEDPSCSGSDPFGAGAVDLRHHAGNYEGRDFPILDPSPVRVDVTNHARTIQAGERLVVAIEAPDRAYYGRSAWNPIITIHGGSGPEASHMVLPIVEGTLGGEAPSLDYPPQPFLPEGAR